MYLLGSYSIIFNVARTLNSVVNGDTLHVHTTMILGTHHMNRNCTVLMS